MPFFNDSAGFLVIITYNTIKAFWIDDSTSHDKTLETLNIHQEFEISDTNCKRNPS